MDLIEQVKQHKALSKQIAELEEQRKLLSLSILQQMNEKTLEFPDYLVRRYSRLCIKLTLDQARAFNAVKWEEIIDKDKIKEIYHQRQPLDGVSEIHWIQIQEKTSS